MAIQRVFISLILFIFFSGFAQAGIYNVGMFWTIADKQDPVCTISTALAGWRINSSETIVFSCSDNTGLKVIECRINGGAWGACNTSTQHTISGLTSGSSTTFEVRATDIYSRVSAISAGQTRTWSTDLANPTVTMGVISGTNLGAPSIAFSGVDSNSGIAGYECSYDTGVASWSSCTSPKVGSTATAGQTYYFRVRAIDNVGFYSTIAQTSWVNGGWSGYSGCSVSCGGGVSTRSCNNPAASASPAGMPCSGSSSVSCNTQACCVNSSLTSNMCAGYSYFGYSTVGCTGCPASLTSSAEIILCTDASCGSTFGGTVSCANGSATVTNDGGCPGKGSGGIYSCTCN